MNSLRQRIRTATRAERNLLIALSASLLLHAMLLALNFGFPGASRAFADKAMEIILVNSRSLHKPTFAQALAQTNLDGGGNTDQNRRLKTPLPATQREKHGQELEQAKKRVRELEARQQRLLTQTRNQQKPQLPLPGKEAQPEPAPQLSGRDLANTALQMARLEGEIARGIDEYNKRPRTKQLGTRAAEYRFAQYVENWRLKVERVGTLNYPEEARGKLYGTLVLSVRIKSDGSVDQIEIHRSSGHRLLDEAARRIVNMAAPYAEFPPNIARDFEILEITRTWNFTRGSQLETSVP